MIDTSDKKYWLFKPELYIGDIRVSNVRMPNYKIAMPHNSPPIELDKELIAKSKLNAWRVGHARIVWVPCGTIGSVEGS